MFNPSAPILQVGKAYLIGESQRGLLITNSLALTPVLPAMNFGPITETVISHGIAFEGMAEFLDKVHAGRMAVGSCIVIGGQTHMELNPLLAQHYQVKTWPCTMSGAILACAKGFAVTSLSAVSESFESTFWRELPLLDYYQLCWIDKDGLRHAFTDVIEVE